MRRLVALVGLLLLAAPLSAGATLRSPTDGTLSVRDLNGSVEIRARGGVIGRCDRCVLILDEWRDDEPITPVVTRGRGTDIDGDGDLERFVGRDVRWRVVGGSFKMIVRRGTDVDLSAVGRGWVRISGTAGTYVLNTDTTALVNTEPVTFQLRAGATLP
jgi:hypothetical protein